MLSGVALPIAHSASAKTDTFRGSELCTACGLCCAGAMHKAGVLDADEVISTEAVGLLVVEGDKSLFGLPCPALENRICTIYPNRPRACQRYRCKVLILLQSGQTTFDEAMGKVAKAKDFIVQTAALMPPGMTLPDARALSVEAPSSTPKVNDPNWASRMRLKLAATVLNVYIDRHFRNSADGQMLELEPLDRPLKTTPAELR